ncbi:MAG: hypothetical protein RBT62_04300 [Spirochaetia bacterium]|jgi:hypothetical protein|nr:hypothetical protein [Spirochaetia bacterium]
MRTLGAFLSRKTVIAAAITVFLLFALFGFPRLGAIMEEETPEGGAFDTVFFYTPAEAVNKAKLYDASQIKASIAVHWTLDLAFPLSYGFLACSCWAFGLRLFAGRDRKPRFGLLWLPLGAIVFDLVENAAVSILLASTPGSLVSRLASIAASLGTALKWLFVLPAITGIIVLPLAGLLYARRNRLAL